MSKYIIEINYNHPGMGTPRMTFNTEDEMLGYLMDVVNSRTKGTDFFLTSVPMLYVNYWNNNLAHLHGYRMTIKYK